MSGEIRIEMKVFESTIKQLSSALLQVDIGLKTNETFKQTNIKPLTNDLESLVRSIELLEKYKLLLQNDIELLQTVGQSLHNQDKDIAIKTRKMIIKQ